MKGNKHASIVKVTDAGTGKLKRYEDSQGRAVAIMKGGKLQVTTRGASLDLVIRNGKLYELGSEVEAYPGF